MTGSDNAAGIHHSHVADFPAHITSAHSLTHSRQTDRQTGRHADRQINRQTNPPVGKSYIPKNHCTPEVSLLKTYPLESVLCHAATTHHLHVFLPCVEYPSQEEVPLCIHDR